MHLILKKLDTFIDSEILTKVDYPAETEYRIEKLFFLKDSYREITLTSKLFSDKFLKFMLNNGVSYRNISPRKVRGVKLPKIKVDRNPREKTKPRVPQFSLLLKK